MKYVIVNLIRGEAKNKHEAITKDLVVKFDAFPIHDRIAPHLTLKRWFEFDAEGMKNLYNVLGSFTTSHAQSNYQLSGFGHFGEDVIYVDVKPSAEMSSTTRDLMNVLHEIKGMTFDEFDNVEDDFHATLVMRALKPFDYNQIWEYLNKSEKINFDMKFDNIAVMKREADRWIVDHIWELPA